MNIGIVGLGLIGGSLGLDFRSQGHRVFGISRKAQTCERAIALGAADDASTNLSLMGQAEVIFICTPLSVMEATVLELIPHLQPDTILTDVGSVKGWVVQAISPHWHNFVGGHPMAGKSESGIEVAEHNLFAGCPYVFTPTEKTPPAALKAVEELVQRLDARIYHCPPDEHDRAVAWISHLPVMVSASLIAACRGENDTSVLKLAKALASSGFRDTSRVGGGNPELGVMMARYNTEALLRSLYAYRDQLDQVIDHVKQEDWQSLKALLQQNSDVRPDFVKN
ncbi:MAG: prephenate/arogenate dehydrogenase [Oscillatoriales cyanobacterium C42_A2020_001]|nr:prephenate/arogenate dehydrogenase [Leptolyngbyaceae cyanobacterium C42_A2020_001]